MSTINAIKPLIETQEQSYRLFVEAKLYGYVDTEAIDKDTAIANVTALRDVHTNLENSEKKSLPMNVADWDIDVTGIASPENGEMEEVRLMTYQMVQEAGLPFRANLPQYIMDKLRAEQKRLYDLAEAYPSIFESELQGWEHALGMLGIYLSYGESEPHD